MCMAGALFNHVLSRNAHEEKQIAIARLNAKLHVRHNEISELQGFRDKYHQMMRETPVFQQPSEPVTPPVALIFSDLHMMNPEGSGSDAALSIICKNTIFTQTQLLCIVTNCRFACTR